MLFDSLTVLEFYRKKHDMWIWLQKQASFSLIARLLTLIPSVQFVVKQCSFLDNQNSAENLQVYNPQGEWYGISPTHVLDIPEDNVEALTMWLSNHQLLAGSEGMYQLYSCPCHIETSFSFLVSYFGMSFSTRAAARRLVKSTISLSSSLYSALHKISGAFVGIATCNGAGITSTSVEWYSITSWQVCGLNCQHLDWLFLVDTVEIWHSLVEW